MTLNGPHHRETRQYEGERLEVKVYHSPPDRFSSDERDVFVRCCTESDITDVSDSEPLEPSSVLPWRNPEPLSMEKQIDRAVSKMDLKIDRYQEKRNEVLE